VVKNDEYGHHGAQAIDVELARTRLFLSRALDRLRYTQNVD
jgi:hypothetical protein